MGVAIRASPQVTTLRYRLGTHDRYDTFDSAPALDADVDGWHLALADGVLTATSVEAIDSEPAARTALEPILRAWEAVAYLRDQHDIYFVAEGDDAPTTGFAATPDEDRILVRENDAYPAPDPAFERTPEVDSLLAILRRFEGDAPSLPQAVRDVVGIVGNGDFGIDDDVMATLRDLAELDQSRFRGPEWQWMQEALRLVTLQVGRRGSGRLSMSDFASQLAITDPGRSSG